MPAVKEQKYIEGIGRRKQAIARVRIYPDKKGDEFIVNEKKIGEYFDRARLSKSAQLPFDVTKTSMPVSARVAGGGTTAQAEAIRLGLARALIAHDENSRGELKTAGFLKRDARVVERKKFGLKKARKASQWSKR